MSKKLSSEIKYILFFALILFAMGANHAFAVMPIPQPDCQISGIIKSVKIEPPIIPKKYPLEIIISPPPYSRPAGYSIGVEIESLSYVSGDINYHTCEENYVIGEINSIFIEKDDVKTGDVFSVNQKISGVVDGYERAFDSSYTLIKNKEKQPDPKKEKDSEKSILKPSDISKKLISEKYANKINNIWFQSEQQLYRVEVSKKGKLFLFIPLNFNFEIFVDAKTGIVNSIKKQWWMYLFGF